MNQPKRPTLTIAIAAFNVEKFIGCCLESLLNQLLHGDIELIVINDASTDRTENIIQDIIKNACSPSVRLIRNPVNLGLSEVRNISIKEAKGKYLWMIDGDDFIPHDIIGRIRDITTNFSNDILVFDYMVVDHEGNRLKYSDSRDTSFVSLVSYRVNRSVWNKLFKLSFLKAQQVSFPKGRLFEDVVPVIRLFSATDNIEYFPVSIYCWRQHPNSITKNLSPKHFEDSINALYELGSLLEGQNKDIRKAYFRGLLRALSRMVLDYRSMSDSYLENDWFEAQLKSLVESAAFKLGVKSLPVDADNLLIVTLKELFDIETTILPDIFSGIDTLIAESTPELYGDRYTIANDSFNYKFNLYLGEINDLAQKSKFIVYGFGNFGKFVVQQFESSVVAIFDRSDSILPRTGFTFISPSQLLDLSTTYPVLITVLGREVEIEQYLMNFVGIGKDRIFCLGRNASTG